MTENTESLISACINGDQTAITRLIQKYQLDVFRLCLSILNDTGEANEATQDTFLKVLQGLQSYQERSSFKSWLMTIAMNISRSQLRKRKALGRLQNLLITSADPDSQQDLTVEDMVIHNEQDRTLWAALENIGEKHRIPIVLRYYHNFSAQEIADLLDINIGTVYSRLSNGRERLRQALEAQNPENSHG